MTQPARRAPETSRPPVLRSRTRQESPRSVSWLMARWLVVKTEGLWEVFDFQGEIGASSSVLMSRQCLLVSSFFFFLIAVLGLCCCVGSSLVAASRRYPPVVVCGLLITVAFHCGAQNPVSTGSGSCDTWAHRLSSYGTWAWLLRGMWNPPRSGINPVSPALACGLYHWATRDAALLSLFESIILENGSLKHR